MDREVVWEIKEKGGQSTVIKKGDECIKIYSSKIKREVLEYYLQLQTRLSQFNPLIINLEEELKTKVGIKNIIINIVPYDENFDESSGEEGLSSRQKFTEGDNLNIFLDENKEDIYQVLKIINEYLNSYFHIDMGIFDTTFSIELKNQQLHFHNVKVEKYDEEKKILFLTITDIAQNILYFILKNNIRVSKILNKAPLVQII